MLVTEFDHIADMILKKFSEIYISIYNQLVAN